MRNERPITSTITITSTGLAPFRDRDRDRDRARPFLVALLLLIFFSGTAFAQGVANVQVGTARLGYLDELDPGWIPVSVPLENLGTETRVDLIATVKGNGADGKTGDLWTSEKSVVLPVHAKRVETLYVKAHEGATSLDLNVLVAGRTPNNGNVSRTITWRTSQNRQRREAPVAVHALLVREAPPDRSFLNWLEPPPPAQSGTPPPITLSWAQVEPRELPDRPEGYDGLDVLALSQTSARDLDEPRRRSLLAWVRNGGRILLLPGNDPAWFRDELVKALLPEDAVTGEIENVRLDNLEKLAPSTPPSTSCRMFTIRSNQRGIRAGGERFDGKRIPYFTAYKHGAGDVIFTAFELDGSPFAQWPHSREELARLLHAAIEPAPDRRRAEDERLAPWFEEAVKEGQLPTPLYLVPVVFLYLVCMGPLNHRVVKRGSTPVLSVVTNPAIALVFTVVCFVAGYIMRGSSTSIDRLAVIETHPGKDLAREVAGLRIRSASSTKYTVSSDALLVATQRSWKEGDAASGVDRARVRQDGGRFTFPDLPLNLWERAFFQAKGPFPLGGAVTIEVKIESTPNSPSHVLIRNGTSLDLGPGVIFIPGDLKGYRVPPLEHGKEHVIQGGTVESSVKPDRAEVLAVVASEEQQKVATASLDGAMGADMTREITYMAQVKNAPPAFEVAGRARPDRDLALLVVQGEDQARDEDVVDYARSVANERWQEEYDDVIAMLSSIPPTSRWHGEALKQRARIATQKYVESAQEAFENGDLEKARMLVDVILSNTGIDGPTVQEIRSRVDRWTQTARSFALACEAVPADLNDATRQWRAVAEREFANDVWMAEAKKRIQAVETAQRGRRGVRQGEQALAEGRAWEALIFFEQARAGLPNLETVHAAVARAESDQHLLDRAKKLAKGTALGRCQAREILRLLVGYLPPDARDDAQLLLEDLSKDPVIRGYR